jgi:hypothetical protein
MKLRQRPYQLAKLVGGEFSVFLGHNACGRDCRGCVSPNPPYYIYSSPEFASLGRHTIASVFFSNNFLLWTEAGYFDALAETKPLLHLWSLGGEEQFYLIVPFVLWWGSRARAVNIFWVIRLGFLSLLTLLFASDIHANSSFYLLQADRGIPGSSPGRGPTLQGFQA